MTLVIPCRSSTQPHHVELDLLDGQIYITPPDPGRYVLACADCGKLTDLDDLAWRRDVPVNVVAAIICRRCDR